MLGAPTATGKTQVALALAAELGLEIVSADAMQVYRGMDVGTAKPSPADRARVPHHLIDVVTPDQPFSVAAFVTRAETAIAEVLARGKLPWVVGGSGYYLRSLAAGLPTLPAADPELQAPLWARLEREGLASLVGELDAASSEDAARAQRNPRRVIRALEVLQRSGRPPSTFPRTAPAHRYAKLVLLPELAALRPRIEARVEAMFVAEGLVAEVQGLLGRYPEQLTATQAIGYKEIVAYLQGHSTLEEAKVMVKRATIRYARRQGTWFRKEPGAARVAGLAPEVEGELWLWLQRAIDP